MAELRQRKVELTQSRNEPQCEQQKSDTYDIHEYADSFVGIGNVAIL